VFIICIVCVCVCVCVRLVAVRAAGEFSFLGALILEAVVTELATLHGLATASDVYLAGTRCVSPAPRSPPPRTTLVFSGRSSGDSPAMAPIRYVSGTSPPKPVKHQQQQRTKSIVNRRVFRSQNSLNALAAGDPPQTPLGGIQRFPDTLVGLRERVGEGERREGRRKQ